jgi:hypothetical protein
MKVLYFQINDYYDSGYRIDYIEGFSDEGELVKIPFPRSPGESKVNTRFRLRRLLGPKFKRHELIDFTYWDLRKLPNAIGF